MNQLAKLPAGKQVLFTFGTLCAVLLVIGALLFFSLRSMDRNNQRQFRAMKKLALIDDTARDVGQMQAEVLREVLASDPGEIMRLDRAVLEVGQIIAQELADYQKFVDTRREEQLCESVLQTGKTYWELTQPVIAFGRANRDSEATQFINAKQAPAYDEYLKATSALTKYVETDADKAATATSRFISQTRIAGDVLIGMAILMAIGTAFAVGRIGRRLKEDNRFLHLEIIERKQAEETLRESEEKFRQLAENITDVFWITSPDLQKVIYASPAYELVWGRSTASVHANPKEWSDAILPDDRERVFAVFSRLAVDAPSVSVEFRIARPDGSVRWISSRGFQIRDAAGKVIRITGIASDITERKQTEESLRLLDTAVDQSKESIMITNADLDLPGPKIVFINPAFTQMTGYNEAEAIGKTPRILQGPRTDKAVLSRLRKNLEHGQVFAGEAINYRKDGKEFNLEWQIAPIRNVGGKITHFVAIQHDITGRKQLEARLFQSQKMETVGKLAGGIAHEFNSILTAIIGQSELLLGDLPPENPLAKNAAEIRKAAERAAILTRQLLAYGRKQILQPENLDLNAVIAGMENTLLHLMGRGVEVRFSPGAGLESVKADAGQIEQVIVNIAMNATEAMPNGGKLMLETANIILDADALGSFSELKAGKYVLLAISDTGAGMSEETRARVFEPFFTTKGVGKGTGLGLATCHGIVKQSGGHISVYSEPGRGTTFKIYLPQVEPQLKLPLLRLDSPDLPRGTETILLVEDDPALREMAVTLLRRLGYRVLSAANGVEALSLKHKPGTGHINLLFTDVVMPHMSGKELADRVRALSPHTMILFTSAYTENAIVHQGVLDKGVALLQKPYTPSALAQKLREVLDQAPKD